MDQTTHYRILSDLQRMALIPLQLSYKPEKERQPQVLKRLVLMTAKLDKDITHKKKKYKITAQPPDEHRVKIHNKVFLNRI